MGHCLGLATRTQISVCKSPFPSAGTTVSLFSVKTVQQRPLLPKEVEITITDTRPSILISLKILTGWSHTTLATCAVFDACYRPLQTKRSSQLQEVLAFWSVLVHPVAVLWTLHGAEINGSTENSRPENGVPKKTKEWKMLDWKCRTKCRVENAGPENVGLESGGPTTGTCVLWRKYAWLCRCKMQL